MAGVVYPSQPRSPVLLAALEVQHRALLDSSLAYPGDKEEDHKVQAGTLLSPFSSAPEDSQRRVLLPSPLRSCLGRVATLPRPSNAAWQAFPGGWLFPPPPPELELPAAPTPCAGLESRLL